MKIAGLQTTGTPGNVDANLAELELTARLARESGAQLLITPELFITGYDIGAAVHELARRDLLSPVREIARTHELAIILGAPEYDNGTYYNTAFFLDHEGTVLRRYRKAHLFGAAEREYFAAGDELFGLVEYGGLTIAMLICYDVEFPEAVRGASLAGAHLVAVPTAQMTPFDFVAEQVIRSRAWENQVYVAYINHDGTENTLTYVGRSSIVDPYATVLDSIEHGNRLLVASVDPEVVARAQKENPYLADRRPELYHRPA
ncbi:carbon-nitrogen hydrolase family protein [Planosporangium flavigriseum]|uniref:Putative hydrolase n=1 Tax=Planosporangium flavigriseum TaxID=373681 RepID=A0A8J3LKT8_9ACTN|nr:carbon-nitrogen hydrolase family protein [Planosporangium flavigriseum]NJC65803.1 carbon-nitrogen hydrolase family protein [Planosporangium flavigriseum]GIG73657.1 putative hydrolase [Planosporangium flavigriseum]